MKYVTCKHTYIYTSYHVIVIFFYFQAQKQLAKIKKSQEESGWFGGWFGGGSSSDKSTSEDLPTGWYTYTYQHHV